MKHPERIELAPGYSISRIITGLWQVADIEKEDGSMDLGPAASALVDYAKSARARGLKVIIAGAGGAAHLPGMVAAMTTVPVFGVPVQSKALSGQDSLLSIVQMPAGVPVGTLAIGEAGATNAALLAAAVLAGFDADLEARLTAWRAARTAAVDEVPRDT